jgi:hypothetical protein
LSQSNASPLGDRFVPFSTQVRLTVEVDGTVFEVWSVGLDSFALMEPRQVPAGPAILNIEVDGRPRFCPITIVETPPQARRIAYVRRREDGLATR